MRECASKKGLTDLKKGIKKAQLKGQAQIALVGNPNVGKSVLFGLLTGKYVTVSNYPGTTVEVSRGICRGINRITEVIDTPGAYSLIPRSKDERVARDILLEERERMVIQVVDAKNLRRSLIITTQLAEMNQKMVLDLNMWDESLDRGINIDTNGLKNILGVPVVKTVATQKKGINALIHSVRSAIVPNIKINYNHEIEEGITEIEGIFKANAFAENRGIALMLLSGDEAIEEYLSDKLDMESLEKIKVVRDNVQKRFNEPLSYIINKKRSTFIDDLLKDLLKPLSRRSESNQILRSLFFFLIMPFISFLIGFKLMGLIQFIMNRFFTMDKTTLLMLNLLAGGASVIGICGYLYKKKLRSGLTIAEALGGLTMHPVIAFPILIVILWLIYKIVGVFGAGTCVDFIESKIFGDAVNPSGGFDLYLFLPFTRLRYDIAHINFQGINYYLGLLLDTIMGRDNLLYELLLSGQSGLIQVGLTYSVAIVFPIVGFFFLVFGLLEDSGYLPRLAIMVDHIFKKIGLNGRAVLPMVLGLGCATMATLTTRILDTKKERTIAILLLALAVPCSAQLGVIASVLSRVSGMFFFLYSLIIFSQFLFVGYLSSRVLKGTPPDFMMEIPPFRFPKFSNVIVKTVYRIQWFMKEAVPLFLLGTFILFIVDKLGLLTLLQKLGEPIVTGILGLPVDTTQGFILGFLRRDYGAVSIFKGLERASGPGGSIDPGQLLVSLVVITLFVPCLANFFVMLKEQGIKNAFLMVAFIFPFAITVGGILRMILRLVHL